LETDADDATVVTGNTSAGTSIGPTVFGMSDKNKDEPSTNENGILHKKKKQVTQKSRLQQHKQQVKQVGLSDERAVQVVQAASRVAQPEPNASQGHNETAAGAHSGGTGGPS
jgi:hypothetical protein